MSRKLWMVAALVVGMAMSVTMTSCGDDDEPTPQEQGEGFHRYVDLGLPSGTLWATCNIGADNPEDYGDYFAWGETTTKSTYSWSNYKWGNGSDVLPILTKYDDDLSDLLPEDDAATVNWGAEWRMPSYDQLYELLTDCEWFWKKKNGKKGYKIVGPNGNSIFLPAAGYRDGSSLCGAGSQGYYCSRKVFIFSAWHLRFSSELYVWDQYNDPVEFGYTVRAVFVPQ